MLAPTPRLRTRGVGLVVAGVVLAGCTDADRPADEGAGASSETSSTPPSARSSQPAASESATTNGGRPTVQEPLVAAEQARLDRRLIAAARARDVDRARRLIGRGADVNTQDDRQESAYLLATSEGPLA